MKSRLFNVPSPFRPWVSSWSRHSALTIAPALFALVCLAPAAGAQPTSVPLRAPDASIREASQRADHAAVLSEMANADTAKRLPGLHAAALLSAGQSKAACAVVEADLKANPSRAHPLALVLAKCHQQTKDVAAERGAWTLFFDGLSQPQSAGTRALAQDPRVLDAATSALLSGPTFAAWLDRAVGGMKEKGGWSIAHPAPNATDKREAYARFLVAIASAAQRSLPQGTTADKEAAKRIQAGAAQVFVRLYSEFGETTAAKAALATKAGRTLSRHRDKDLALKRARTLSRRHDNKAVLATLKKHLPKASDKSDRACEIRYIVGKAQRKMRRYRGARRNLDAVAKTCTGDWQKRARYLTARVASFQGAKDAVKTFDAFVAAYPKDTLTDDVLIWKAEHLALRRQKPAAEKVYETLIAQHPKGDMVNTARFDLALMRARRGDVSGARSALDALARNSLDSNILVADRALYWRARLLAYPKVDSWMPTSDKAALAKGAQALVALARARPASFYGHLAQLVAATLAADAVAGVTAPPARSILDAKMSVPVSGALQKDARFSAAVALHHAGYDDTAIALLEDIDHQVLPTADALALTALLTNAGAHAESHQVMRDQGLAVPKGQPSKTTMALWALSFPKAHAGAIEAAAAATKLPPEVLFGLAREESAFDASVVSWAGAIGLTQLMMFTAKEEAQLLKKPNPSVDDLRHPELNARLGANHLMRRQKLGHPLLAIAAYNAGPGNVNKWTKRQKGPIDAWVESIPIAQTRGYVVKVTGSWVVYSLLAGKAAPEYALSLPGRTAPTRRAIKQPLKVAPAVKGKIKRPPPKG